MSSVSGHTSSSQRPERSRNAKAQARHRAKRKAYIDQLEQTVTKLQTQLGFSPEQVAAMPPPLVKIRELEQDNARLQKENEALRRMVSERGLPDEIARRNSFATYQDSRVCDRDYKRRKMSGHVEGVYISPSETPPQDNDSLRPPPLTIPQPMSHHYGNLSNNANGHDSTSALFSLPYQLPNTPSGSSATSSPPFSPATMQSTRHPIHHQRSLPNQHTLPGYSQHSQSYDVVKVEEDGYAASINHNPHFPLQSYNNPAPDNSLESWHSYPPGRAHLQR